MSVDALNDELERQRLMQCDIAETHAEAMKSVASTYSAALIVLGVIGLVLGLCAIFA